MERFAFQLTNLKQIVVAALSAFDAVARSVDIVTLASISIASYTIPSTTVTTALSWAIVTLGFYLAGKSIYSRISPFPYRRYVSPFFFTVLALGVGITIDVFLYPGAVTLGFDETNINVGLGVLAAVLALEVVAMGVYLRVGVTDTFYGRGGMLHSIIDAITGPRFGPEMVWELHPFGDENGYRSKAKSVFVVAGLLTAPAWFAGIIGLLIITFQPLPDVLIVLWTVGSIAYTVLTPSSSDMESKRFDPLSRILEGSQPMVRSTTGAEFTVIIGVGLTASIVTIYQGWNFLATGTVGQLVENQSAVAPYIARWDAVGIVIVFGVAGAYSLWAWIRELERLPQFLSYRQDDKTEVPVAKPRVPWVAVPSCISIWILTYVYEFFVMDVRFGEIDPQLKQIEFTFFEYYWLLFALLWPLVVLLFVLLAVKGIRRDHQSVKWEGVVILSNVIVQVFAIGSIVRVSGNRWPASLIVFAILFVYGHSKISLLVRKGSLPITESRFTLAVGVVLLLLSLGISSYWPIQLLIAAIGSLNVYSGLMEMGIGQFFENLRLR